MSYGKLSHKSQVKAVIDKTGQDDMLEIWDYQIGCPRNNSQKISTEKYIDNVFILPIHYSYKKEYRKKGL